MSSAADEMRRVYLRTVIVRKPTHGIVRRYHELPYFCLGESLESGFRTTCVRGKVQVSPQFLIRPGHYQPSYEEIFGEDSVDGALAGRVFGFLGFPGKPVQCSSEYLEVEHVKHSVDEVLSQKLDLLDRNEDIVTGIIITPNNQFYPISIERFIASILEDEFSV
ncbi:MAG: hypothetical protein HYV27_14680 [Candidatus Hydrogenedentes bacterium]|nr:hypothetical protein [Candidatus Hydrogenedentota bacterium]